MSGLTTRPRRFDITGLCSAGALAGIIAAGSLLSSGCATASLDRSRECYFRRDPTAAQANFPALPQNRRGNALLYLLERATILQTVSNYVDSAADFLNATALDEKLRVGSVTESSGSLVINDSTKSFRGVPFEQVLMHAFAAKNYLAMGQVDDAAVEARRIVERLSGDLDRFPDSAYARYLAGACLDLTGEHDGAAIEYGKASSILKTAVIDPGSGNFFHALTTNAAHAGTNEIAGAKGPPYASAAVPPGWTRDMVCFIGIGILGPADTSTWRNLRWGKDPYADIYVNGVLAGRSVPLGDTHQLHAATQARIAASKAAKAVLRTGIKFTLANVISERNDALGSLVWLLLIATEGEDTRRWETLPRWLHAARVRCPDRISEVRVVFRRADGTTVEEHALPPSPAKSSRLTLTFTRAL